ncbi:hypothetical protein HYPSUDRAFT_217419 [Hypholoma sublateritium FD-334 SS-4]|uniref:Secreted protein n=1 Tax=Hypholoma sublateritium (strain FD-334 SS-4) TaxID=945553 RepID=A0A0D2NLQ6_HYPSF|nr:hypothetical protein HYPSUDRAFT_217419 [Hypholoma sublateritium FD-334 SS-4]
MKYRVRPRTLSLITLSSKWGVSSAAHILLRVVLLVPPWGVRSHPPGCSLLVRRLIPASASTYGFATATLIRRCKHAPPMTHACSPARMNNMREPSPGALPAHNRVLAAAALLIRSDPLQGRRHSARASKLQVPTCQEAVPANITVREIGLHFHLRRALHA